MRNMHWQEAITKHTETCKWCKAGQMDIKYTVQTETSRIQRNGSGGRTDQTAGQYRNGLEIGREKKNIYQGGKGRVNLSV